LIPKLLLEVSLACISDLVLRSSEITLCQISEGEQDDSRYQEDDPEDSYGSQTIDTESLPILDAYQHQQ
jgi:hypothetical protein